MDSELFVSGTLDSQFQFFGPVFRIPKPRIADFMGRNFADSRIRIPLTWDKFYDSFLSLLSNFKTNIQPPPDHEIRNQMQMVIYKPK